MTEQIQKLITDLLSNDGLSVRNVYELMTDPTCEDEVIARLNIIEDLKDNDYVGGDDTFLLISHVIEGYERNKSSHIVINPSIQPLVQPMPIQPLYRTTISDFPPAEPITCQQQQ